MAIHPYATPQPSDEYFVKLAGRLYKAVMLSGMPEAFRKNVSLRGGLSGRCDFRTGAVA